MGKQQKYMSTMQFSFGEVKTEIKPVAGFEDQHQALDAMLITAQTSIASWVVDNTFDPNAQNGKQEHISASIKDGQQKIADLLISVPTTDNYSKVMFENFVQQTIIAAVQKTAKAYPSIRSGQQPASSTQSRLAQTILPDALQETSRIKPRQLQTR